MVDIVMSLRPPHCGVYDNNYTRRVHSTIVRKKCLLLSNDLHSGHVLVEMKAWNFHYTLKFCFEQREDERERWVRKWSGLTWKIGNLSFVNTLISLTQTCSNKFLIQTCYVTWTEGDGKNTNWIFILSSFIFYVYVKISFFDLLKHENILWITVFDAYSGMITFCIYLSWD